MKTKRFVQPYFTHPSKDKVRYIWEKLTPDQKWMAFKLLAKRLRAKEDQVPLEADLGDQVPLEVTPED